MKIGVHRLQINWIYLFYMICYYCIKEFINRICSIYWFLADNPEEIQADTGFAYQLRKNSC